MRKGCTLQCERLLQVKIMRVVVQQTASPHHKPKGIDALAYISILNQKMHFCAG